VATETSRRTTTVRQRIVGAFSSSLSRLGISVGPSLIWLFLLLLAPITFMVTVSFLTVDSFTYEIIWSQPTVDNYTELFSGSGPIWETAFFKSLSLSYFIASVTTVLCLVLAFPLAYFLARRDDRTFKIVIFLVLLPFFTMYLVRAYSWLLMFGPSGAINDTLVRLGILDGPMEAFNYGVIPIIVGLTHAYFPYMLVTLYASLDGLDFTLVEAARDLGASRIDVVKDHIIPLTLPGIVGGSLFVFVPSVGAFITPAILGANKVQMIGILIENRAVGEATNPATASAASMVVVVSIVAALLLVFRYVTLDELGGV